MAIFLQTAKREPVELVLLDTEVTSEAGRLAVRASGIDDPAGRLTRAAVAFFGLRAGGGIVSPTEASKEPPPALFREKATGLLRTVHNEMVIRFTPSASQKKCRQILKAQGLTIRSQNPFINKQYIVVDSKHKRRGADLVDMSNKCMELEEVVFATPNFVSEYRRDQIPVIPVAQWHLKNTAAVAGQKKDEDVKAAEAWEITMGKPSITIAILDDGVDVDHPNLKPNIKKNPDPDEPRDKFGKDFYVPDDEHPEHFDPRPKIFQFPFNELAGNDIHGTPCAGVAAGAGKNGGPLGIAPKCRILAVKIFHADAFASDARVADAIRYAARHADILSCSWSAGLANEDIRLAIEVDAATGRDGKGAAVFCAAGNEFGSPVGFPAKNPQAIAIGASTDQRKLAAYSNIGPELWIVAPSGGGKRGILTTDVSFANRGFNLGSDAAGGADGLHTNSFSGTSSATPLAAGVGALVLSVKPSLTRDELKRVLADTADKIGTDHDPVSGHSNRFGFGRVNAAAAVQAVST